MIACEVVAKLGDSIIEIAHVAAGDLYSSPLVPFPLVVGEPTEIVVHRPVGVAAWNRGLPIAATKLRLADDDVVVLSLAPVTLYVLPIRERAAPVPRQRVERRPFVYGAAVLVLHLLVWGLAEANHAPPIEKLPAPPPTHRVRVAHVEEERPPPLPPAATTVSEPAERSLAVGHGKRKRATSPRSGREATRATSGEAATLGAFGDVSMLIPRVDVVALANEATVYDAQAAGDAGWGGSRRHFDPLRNCASNCGTIATGPYATLSFQNRPRPVPQITVASDNGTAKAATLAAHGSLVACYLDRALDGATGTVTVELEAGADGVYGRLYNHGLDTVAPCVGAVIDALHLTGPARSTASITIAFTL